ncbi:MAG: hypothetical protein AAGF72_13090 [Pseudomonadota bacterium]
MSSSLLIEVTDVVRRTRKGNGVMQTIGIHGGTFPVESSVYVDNADEPLKPGRYTHPLRLEKKGMNIVLEISYAGLRPVQGKAA